MENDKTFRNIALGTFIFLVGSALATTGGITIALNSLSFALSITLIVIGCLIVLGVLIFLFYFLFFYDYGLSKPKITPAEKTLEDEYTAKTITDALKVIKDDKEFEIEPQTENFDIESVKLKFPFLPKDYLEFSKHYNSITNTGTINGFNSKLNKNGLLSNKDTIEFQKYLDGYHKKYKVKDWYFIGDDGMGGEFAFSTKNNDGKVYYFDHENPNELITYKNFLEFLNEEIIYLIYI